jgi:serine/threonine protein kinase
MRAYMAELVSILPMTVIRNLICVLTSNQLIDVHHLHHHSIIHGDLKLEDIPVDSYDHFIIADVGPVKVLMLDNPNACSPYNPTGTFASLSQALYSTNVVLCCTTAYITPEIILDGGHGFAVDPWGCSWGGYVI